MTQRILVVDDEPAVSDLLAYNLRKAHYEVAVAADGHAALRAVGGWSPDLIILDLMLPGIDGIDVCRQVRQAGDIPIIMLTARDDELDRVLGLELGADDYVCKPFSVRELLARVKAVLRRRGGQPEPGGAALAFGRLRLDQERRSGSIGGQELDLTRLEFDLLATMIAQPGRVFTRELLLEQVWGYDYVGDTRAVDSVIKRLRTKIRALDPAADYLVAVRSLGYKISEGQDR